MNRKERRAAAKQSRSGKSKSADLVAAKVQQAIEMVQAGDLADAEPLLDAARRDAPDDPEVMHQLGMIYVRTGRSEPGIALLKQSVELRPNESLYWNNLAAAYLSVEMSEQAVEAARKTVALQPGYSMAWQNLAFGLRDFADHAGAVGAFEQSDKTGTLEPSSLASWGESLGILGRLAEGEQVVRRALVRAEEDPAILTLLGWLLVEQRKDAEAREVFKNSLELKPNQFLAAFNYGVLLLRKGETEAALRWLRRATSIDPKSAAAWRVLALELYRHGLREEALPAAERSHRLAPDDAAINVLLEKLKATAPDQVDEVIDFSEPVPIGPEDASDSAKRKKESGGSDDSGLLDFATINFGD